jgi:hypothetical protein
MGGQMGDVDVIFENKPRVARKYVKKCWLQGYLKDGKCSPDLYLPSQEDSFWRIKFLTR